MQEVKTTEINETPLQPNDIGNLEIEMENDEAQELTQCRKCRIFCGRENIYISILVLGIGGGNFYLLMLYLGSYAPLGFLTLVMLSWSALS